MAKIRFIHKSVAALLSLTALPVAFAAYDRPVSWKESLPFRAGDALRASGPSKQEVFHATIGTEMIETALTNSMSRVSPQFEVAEQMKPTVRFWLQIYTKWTSHEVALYDENHPDVVYEVIDLKPILEKSKNPIQFEILSQREIHAKMNRYREAFRKLNKSAKYAKKAFSPNSEETKILAAIQNQDSGSQGEPSESHHHSWRQWSQGLRLQRGLRDEVITGLKLASPYMRRIEQIFTELNLPVELARIAMVESSFNPKATSRVGAVGVWQFMENSGREFLIIDQKKKLDERRSPLKSAVAAAQLLRRNNQILKNWPASVIAYNHGFTGLFRMSRAERAPPRLWNHLRLCGKSTLGWASRNYYAEFLAMVHADAHRDLFFPELPPSEGSAVEFFLVNSALTGEQIAFKLGVSLEEFRKLNPDISNIRGTLPRGFWVVLPRMAAHASGSVSTQDYLRARRKVARKLSRSRLS